MEPLRDRGGSKGEGKGGKEEKGRVSFPTSFFYNFTTDAIVAVTYTRTLELALQLNLCVDQSVAIMQTDCIFDNSLNLRELTRFSKLLK